MTVVSVAATTSSTIPSLQPVETTRLHITPLTPSLLSAIVPASLLPSASNISYHSIQTFPEKSYGYVDLPTIEAKKLQKKLNGATLKGQKIRIEEAMPEKRKRLEADGEGKRHKSKHGKDKLENESPADNAIAPRAKAEKQALPGYELPDGRHVRRGWTEPAPENRKEENKGKKRKAQSSQHTNQPELLFRTTLPAGAFQSVVSNGKKSSRSTTVHEFAKTKKEATFLRDNKASVGTKRVFEYVDDVGWVDEQGEVVEPAVNTSRKRQKVRSDEVGGKPAAAAVVAKVDEPKQLLAKASHSPKTYDADDVSAASQKPRDHLSDRENLSAEPTNTEYSRNNKVDSVYTNGVNISNQHHQPSPAVGSEEATDDDPSSAPSSPSSVETDTAHDAAEEPQIQKNNSADALSEAREKPIHPLEALYKRPHFEKPSSLAPIKTSFSFFEPDAENEHAATATLDNPPQTPFTRQDWQKRNIRSAAPTPDTAAPGRKFKMPWSMPGDGESGEDTDDGEDLDERGSDEERDDYRDGNENAVPAPAQSSVDLNQRSGAGAAGANDTVDKPESEFAKWFWEHRGDLNRAWKKRRREALKQQRQRENKRLGRKIL